MHDYTRHTPHMSACPCQYNCHVPTHIHVCILTVPTHMHAHSQSLVFTHLRAHSRYTHTLTHAVHPAAHPACAHAKRLRECTHSHSDPPAPTGQHHAFMRAAHTQLSPERVHRAQVWGVGLLDRLRLTSQLPPCLGLCLCSCALSPKCREGAGRATWGRGRPRRP